MRRIKKSDWIFILLFNPLIALLIVALVLFLPPYQIYKTVYLEPSVYDNVFVAALGDKYDRLKEIDSPKIAVVGGSSVAFGLDSRLLGQFTDREVVNFGLFATLGSKIMLDLSEDGLNEGDIVVFAPELDERTMSLYFGARSAWQAIDASDSLYDTLYRVNGEELEAEKESFAEEKREYLESGKPDPSGVYNRRNFNEYGDISYPRPKNEMALGYDPNTTFELTSDIISPDFLDYFNSYCQRLEARGVTVYYSFCPINEMALAEGTDDAAILALESYLKENLSCRVISSLSEHIMDYRYFYDTNLHLNDAGVKYRTELLVNDLRCAMGIGDDVSLNVPPPPGLDGSEVIEDGNNEHASLFTYEEIKNGETVLGLAISGLSDEGRAFEGDTVSIPYSHEGLPIIILRREVLSGLTKLKSVTIGENISSIDDAAFSGCPQLSEIHIKFGTNCLVTVPGEDEPGGLMEGAAEGCLIYCDEKYRNDFLNHYTWQHYYKFFAK